jgi:hypothetical protein
MKATAKETRYWIVSPNVRNHPPSLPLWRELIKQTRTAIMGYSPDHRKGMQLGPKFAEEIEEDDVILITRGKNAHREVVACGRVASAVMLPRGSDETLLKTANGATVQAPESFGSYRLLDPFVELEREKWPSFNRVTYQIWAMYELKRDTADNARICNWLDDKLVKLGKGPTVSGSKSKSKPKAGVQSLPTTEPYLTVTKAAARRIAKAEAKLVRKYADWLGKNHKRYPMPYSLPISFSLNGIRGHVACDLYDEDERTMIEAKSATDRHSIRLAIGQLYDYAYLMRQIRGKRVRRAMLLPNRLDSEMEEFLKSLQIAAIWKDGQSFSDNISETFR